MRKLKLLELGRKTVEEFKSTSKKPLVVVCDNIRSGLNIGSIFRTSDAFAVDRIYLTGICSVPPNKEINKSAIGATESVEWEYHERVEDVVLKLKREGYTILVIEQTTDSISMLDYDNDDEKVAIVLGNEVKGISDSILDKVDYAIEIPQFGTKHSLNVSVCAGIVIHHFSSKM